MSDDVLRRMKMAGDAAYDAGQYRRAAELWRAARQVAGASARWQVALLFWEGEGLAQAGEIDEAVPLLLEAIRIEAPEVNPADVSNARTTLVDIAGARNRASYTRRLLAESHLWLQRVGREDWAHKLDRLEAGLEGDRGDWPAAMRADLRGWERHVARYPYFTRATHLLGLCRAAYHTRDVGALERWSEALRANQPEGEGDRVHAGLGALLTARARADGARLPPSAIEDARSTLRRASGIDEQNPYARIDCAHALALGGCFSEAEAALAIPTPSLPGDRYHLALCCGDLHLQRARAALGQEPVDDEWHDDPPPPPPTGGDPQEALSHLDAAERTYASVDADAHTEDERLETTYHERRLAQRRERIARLRQAAASRQGGT